MCSPPCIAVAFPVDPYIRKEVLYLPTYWLHVFYMVLHWKIRLVLIARPYIPMCGAVNFSDGGFAIFQSLSEAFSYQSQIKKEFFGALCIWKVRDAQDPTLATWRPAATVHVYDSVMDEALRDAADDAPHCGQHFSGDTIWSAFLALTLLVVFWTTLPAVLVLGVFFSRPGFIWNSSLHLFHSCFGQPPHLESPTISTSFPLGLAYQSHRPPLEAIPSLSRDVGITHKLFYPYFFSE